MAYALPTLPYAVDALEPYVDATTMTIHHGKHHQVSNHLTDWMFGRDLSSVVKVQAFHDHLMAWETCSLDQLITSAQYAIHHTDVYWVFLYHGCTVIWCEKWFWENFHSCRGCGAKSFQPFSLQTSVVHYGVAIYKCETIMVLQLYHHLSLVSSRMSVQWWVRFWGVQGFVS